MSAPSRKWRSSRSLAALTCAPIAAAVFVISAIGLAACGSSGTSTVGRTETQSPTTIPKVTTKPKVTVSGAKLAVSAHDHQGYLSAEVGNTGSKALVLEAVTSSQASTGMFMQGTSMLSHPLTIPAHDSIELSGTTSSGTTAMFTGVSASVKPGSKFKITLTFKSTATVDATAKVVALGS